MTALNMRYNTLCLLQGPITNIESFEIDRQNDLNLKNKKNLHSILWRGAHGKTYQYRTIK